MSLSRRCLGSPPPSVLMSTCYLSIAINLFFYEHELTLPCAQDETEVLTPISFAPLRQIIVHYGS